MLYALINRDLTDTGKRRNLNEAPPSADDLAPGKPYWVPVVEEVNDTSTGPDRVDSGWQETVEAGRLVRSRVIRDMNPGEVQQKYNGIANSRFGSAGVDRGVFQTLFDLENRVRALEGTPPIQEGQFRAIIAQRMRGNGGQ